MAHSLTPDKQNAIIEDALSTHPIAPIPRDITVEVLTRIRTSPKPRPVRFTWNDLVLAIALFLCMSAIWFSVANLPPIVVAQIRKESILLYQYLLVNMRWLVPALSFGLAAFLSALTIPYLRRELLK